MKFSLARPALALAVSLTLASCGAGGKATFPIHVTVNNVLYDGLVLTTNGMDYAVKKPATGSQVVFVFPNEIEYGEVYDVIPKGRTTTSLGAQPLHQTCSENTFPKTGTAGQLAKIDIYYTCVVNSFALGGTIKNLRGTGLVLTNGSLGGTYAATPVTDATTKEPTGADISFTLSSVPFGTTYGVTVLTQPSGQTCTVTGGENNAGAGTMDEPEEKTGGVTNLVVTCVNKST